MYLLNNTVIIFYVKMYKSFVIAFDFISLCFCLKLLYAADILFVSVKDKIDTEDSCGSSILALASKGV